MDRHGMQSPVISESADVSAAIVRRDREGADTCSIFPTIDGVLVGPEP